MNSIRLFYLLLIIALYTGVSFAQLNFDEYIIDNSIDGITGIHSSDFDGDGDNDIAATSANSNQVVWYRNDGGSPINWVKQIIDNAFTNALYVYSADMNGDSRPDVIATNGIVGQVAWWQNNGGTPLTWTKHIVASGFENAHGIMVSDINNDGYPDILATAAGANTISWWKNSGDDTIVWTEQVIDDSFTGTQSVYAEDIDGDGDQDVLGAAGGLNQIAMWRNDGGDPIVWTKQIVGNGFGLAHWVYSEDIDGDGLMDVVGAAFTGNQIAWWKNSGDNPITWTKQQVGGMFQGALHVHAGDMDNDGDIDILGTSFVADDIALWINDGGDPIVWTRITIDDYFNGAWPIFTNDFDNDGDLDVVAGADLLGGPGVTAPFTWWENDLITGVIEPRDNIPSGFLLKQNYPNPFNPSTNINFAVNEETNIRLEIYDVKGELITTVINGGMPTGTHTVKWTGCNQHNQKVGAGLYIAKLSSGNSSQQIKMLLLK